MLSKGDARETKRMGILSSKMEERTGKKSVGDRLFYRTSVKVVASNVDRLFLKKHIFFLHEVHEVNEHEVLSKWGVPKL